MKTPTEHKPPLPEEQDSNLYLLDALTSIAASYRNYRSKREHDIEQLQQQLSALLEPPPNLVAKDKQNELILILHLIFKMGLIDGCNEKEFMTRVAMALGCPGIKAFNQHLYKTKETAHRFEDIIHHLIKEAENFRKP